MKKYRIKEQFGFFVIEKEIEVINYKFNFWSRLGIVKPKKIKNKIFVSLDNKYRVSSFMLPTKKYKTFDKALKALSEFDAIIHDVSND